MKIKTLALILCASFCVGLSSCKDDGRQDLPKVVKTESGVNPENTGGHAKYTGPMTNFNVSIKATFSGPSKSRAFNTSFKQVENGDNNLMQINWEKGKEYKILGCLRSKTKNWESNDFVATGTLKGVVTDVSGETYTLLNKEYGTSGTMQISGSIKYPKEWLSDLDTDNPKFNPNDVYFAGYLIPDDNTEIIKDSTVLKFTLPKKMIPIADPKNGTEGLGANRIPPQMNVLTAIPFTSVILEKRGSEINFVKSKDGQKDKDQVYPIRPVQSLYHFKLRNSLIYPIRFSQDALIKFPHSSIAWGVDVYYDFWEYDTDRKFLGTDKFFFHYGDLYKDGSKFQPEGNEEYDLSFDYRYVKKLVKDGYITIEPKHTIDFYIVGAPVRASSNGGASYALDIDLTSLNIQYQSKSGNWTNYLGKYRQLYCYSDGKLEDGSTPDGGSKYSNTPSEEYSPLYYKAKNPSALIFKEGASYYKEFDISSDLMFDLIGYRWDDVTKNSVSKDGNYSLIQLFNASNDNVDLTKYYLVRTLYNLGGTNDHKILFCSNGWDYTTYLGYAVMCPLARASYTENALYNEVSPRGYDADNVYFLSESQDTYKVQYSVNCFSNILSGMYLLIGAEGFWGNGNFTPQKIQEQYNINNSYFANKNNTWPQWTGAAPTDFGGFMAIRDGRKDSENNDDNNWYQRVPGNAWSSVMARGNGNAEGCSTSNTNTIGQQTLNGWALVKRIDENGRHKFVVIDCYGPCPSNNNNTDTGNSGRFVQWFGKTNASPLIYLRNQDICQPHGADMDITTNETDAQNYGWKKFYSYRDDISTPVNEEHIGVRNR